jgi:hypothetical protein
MPEKIIQLKFNRAIFVAAQKSIWKFAIRVQFKRHIYMSIGTLLLLALTFGLENKNESSFNRTLAMGFLIFVVIGWVGFLEQWITLINRTKVQANRFEKEGLISTYIFNDFGITYQDKEKEMKLSWQLFKPFEAYKDNIYIKLKDTGSIAFHLSRQEVGYFDYDEIYTLLTEKVG